jgi:hypothetical protein
MAAFLSLIFLDIMNTKNPMAEGNEGFRAEHLANLLRSAIRRRAAIVKQKRYSAVSASWFLGTAAVGMGSQSFNGENA